ncbi:protoporphyrinogen IX oxidase [Niastella vici]|uniref:Protoporphyrinogen IX oxidase n=1 Tax=Niastella vici TaxID=1703345 RepID=A0A1V9G2Y2_9BACT|nr:CopD family protein [Niastella vici]OQP64940.1 protoporphyrinogen IX oxidase [Niastella vici]
MNYSYIIALHIVFIVTWFSGLFYIVRLFVYNTEAGEKSEPEKTILRNQFNIMIRRLWFGITWPSAIITLILGPWLWFGKFGGASMDWLNIKLFFVIGLYAYHFTLHAIYKQQMKGVFKYSSQKLRIWNEVATIFLVAIVMLAEVKENMSVVWGLVGLIGFVVVLMSAIKIYKNIRQKKK